MSFTHTDLTPDEAIRELKAMKLYEKDMIALLDRASDGDVANRQALIAGKQRHVRALKMAIAALGPRS